MSVPLINFLNKSTIMNTLKTKSVISLEFPTHNKIINKMMKFPSDTSMSKNFKNTQKNIKKILKRGRICNISKKASSSSTKLSFFNFWTIFYKTLKSFLRATVITVFDHTVSKSRILSNISKSRSRTNSINSKSSSPKIFSLINI